MHDYFLEENNDSSSEGNDANKGEIIALGIVVVLLSLAIIILNALTIIAILSSRHLRAQPTSIFILFLALADLMVSWGVVCLTGELALDSQQHAICLTCALIQAGTVGWSYTSLLLLAVDRYIALTRPLHYHNIVTVKRSLISICSLWVISISWGWTWIFVYAQGVTIDECTGPMAILPPALNLATMFGFVVVITLVNIILYGRICFIARQQQKSITRLAQSFQAGSITEASNTSDHLEEEDPATNAIELQVKPANCADDTDRNLNCQKNELPPVQVQAMDKSKPSNRSQHRRSTIAFTTLNIKRLPSISTQRSRLLSIAPTPSQRSRRRVSSIAAPPQRPHKKTSFWRQEVRKEVKLVQSMLVVMGTNVILALPYFITAAVTEDLLLRHISALIIMSNSAVNPLIHTWANKKYRSAVLRLWPKNRVGIMNSD